MPTTAALRRKIFEFPGHCRARARASFEYEKDLWRTGNQGDRVSELWRVLIVLLVTVGIVLTY